MLSYRSHSPATFAFLFVLLMAAPAFPEPNEPLSTAKNIADRLQGDWLFEAAAQGKKNYLPMVWTAKLTIAGDSFKLPNFLDSKKDLTGKFALDPAANPIAADVKLDEFDLSSLDIPLKFPTGAMPGMMKLEEDRLTICFQCEAGGIRPAKFDIMDDKVVRLRFVKSPPGFKEFPKAFTVNVTGPDGKPADGATLSTFMSNGMGARKKDAKSEWQYAEPIKIGADGTAQVNLNKLRLPRLLVRHAEKKLMALAAVSPVSLLKGDLNIQLQPECKLTGTYQCDQLKKLGQPIGTVNAYLMLDGDRFAFYSSAQGTFEFFVPSNGTYTIFAYEADFKAKNVTVTASPGQSELTVAPINLTANNFVQLKGQPAPELKGVMGWKGDKVTLAELKGKYVLLEFWGFWCGPCVGSMPVLIELHEKFADKGLAIVGVHMDIDGEIDSAAKLDEKIAGCKKDLWKGKELPFPVALTSGKFIGEGEERTHGGAVEQYGVQSFPTTILIDRDGKVVGKFNGRDPKVACAEMEKLLRAKK